LQFYFWPKLCIAIPKSVAIQEATLQKKKALDIQAALYPNNLSSGI